MRFNYDQEADALMINIRDGFVVRSEEVDNGTLLDLDEHGALLAIEVLRPARRWPLAEILESYEVSESDSQTLRALWEDRGRRLPFLREPVLA